MGVKWTKEQQSVIDLRDRSILVSAAAGSGKTAVLVERIITMLTRKEDPLSVDELLIVTFTEAAAAEMKERIRTAIEKKAQEDPFNEHLRQQATLIHSASITSHSLLVREKPLCFILHSSSGRQVSSYLDFSIEGWVTSVNYKLVTKWRHLQGRGPCHPLRPHL